MAADAQGNDLEAVDVPYTGFMAVNFDATTAPTQADLEGSPPLPTGYEYVGLFTEDGGYSEEVEEGDLLKFFQDGYALAGGDSGVSGALTLAEDNAVTRKLAGIENGVKVGTVYNGQIGVIIATYMKSGRTVYRGGIATPTSFTPSKEERGAVSSGEFKFTWAAQQDVGGFYRIAVVDAPVNP